MTVPSRPGASRAPILAASICLSLALAVTGFTPMSAAASPALVLEDQGQKADAAEDVLAQADAALKRKQYDEALKLYKRANAAMNERSPEALWGMAQAYNGLGATKNVSATVEKYLPLVSGDPKKQADANNLCGLALFDLGQLNSDAKKFTEAEPYFKRAHELSPDLPVVHYNLALVLFKRKADPEGIEQMNHYLEEAPTGPYAARAKQFIENPRRARENYATEFSATSSEGELISLAELKGKVVVLDFWATWCGPCKEALPSLKGLVKRSTQEPLVTISISSDREAPTWRKFIADNQMTWPQLHDPRGALNQTYGVTGIPTYVVIDHEGIVRERLVGWSSNNEADLQEAIRKAVKAAKAAQAKKP